MICFPMQTITENGSNNVLKTLETAQFIFEYTGNKRNKKYVFERYFKLF